MTYGSGNIIVADDLNGLIWGVDINIPVNTTLPSITGSPLVGNTVSVLDGVWTNAPSSFTYQWKRTGAVIPGATSNSYLIVLADINNTISCTVTAINGFGSGSATTLVMTINDTSPPTVPANLTASTISGTEIDLSWTASTDNVGVTNYQIYRDNVLVNTLGNVVTYQDLGLTSGTLYSYTVKAGDAAGNWSAQSAPATATTTPTNQCDISYTVPGTYSWTVPVGVTSVSAVCIGAGGPGSNATMNGSTYATAGTVSSISTPTAIFDGDGFAIRDNYISGAAKLLFNGSATGPTYTVNMLKGMLNTITIADTDASYGRWPSTETTSAVTVGSTGTGAGGAYAAFTLYPRTVRMNATAVTVGNHGSGYTFANISFTNTSAQTGSWVAPIATATVSGGKVTAITITNPGTNQIYTDNAKIAPSISIQITGDGVGATASAFATVSNATYYTIVDKCLGPATYSATVRGSGYDDDVSGYPANDTYTWSGAAQQPVLSDVKHAHQYTSIVVTGGNGATFTSPPVISISGENAVLTGSTTMTATGTWGTANYTNYVNAGSGGGLGYKNNIAVTPGSMISVTVGSSALGSNGGTSSFGSYVTATGGTRGGVVQAGGTFSGAGVSGFAGGITVVGSNSSGYFYPSGGGGAAGYAGTGGAGVKAGSATPALGSPGTGGSAAGGGSNRVADSVATVGVGGGGVGLYGTGASGTNTVWNTGAAGSSGVAGVSGLCNSGLSTGGIYGGGGGPNSVGGSGAVRLMWGAGHIFPNYATTGCTDTWAPSVPAGVIATAASSSVIDLSWTAASDNLAVTQYRVYRDGSLLIALGNVTTYQNNSLTPSTAYSYTVSAGDAAGNWSAQSAATSATTLAADTTAPTVPTGLTATAASSSQINLSWTASTDAVGVTQYRIYRGGSLLTTIGNLTSYSDTGLSEGSTYSYTVSAGDAAGNWSVQSSAASATTIILAGEAIYTTAGSYSWVCPAGVTSVCVLLIAGGSGGKWQGGTASSGGEVRYYNNINVIPGNSYTGVVGAKGTGVGPYFTPAETPGTASSFHTYQASPKTGSGYSGAGRSTLSSGYGGEGGHSQDHHYGSGGGGGVGLYNLGAPTGADGTTISGTYGTGGGGGSGGFNGGNGSSTSGGGGGMYGGGGGCAGDGLQWDYNASGGDGGRGAVRIIWGAGRSWPSNAA